MACWSWTWASNLPAAAVMLFAAATSSYNRAPKASSVQFMNTSFHADMHDKELCCTAMLWLLPASQAQNPKAVWCNPVDRQQP
jgi:hypothetical protein